MSFFWLAGRQPCMITADLKYIVVFDISTNCPVYAPCYEKYKDAFLGTFTLADNAFGARCGLRIDAQGTIQTVLQLMPHLNKDVKKASKMSEPAVTCVDQSTQTDPVPGLNADSAGTVDWEGKGSYPYDWINYEEFQKEM